MQYDFVTMTKEDETFNALVKEIYDAIHSEFSHHPDLDWVRKKLKSNRYRNADWSNDVDKKDAKQDLIEAASKWAKERGLITQSAKREKGEQLPVKVLRAFATHERLKPFIEVFRTEYFGINNAPFEATREGFEKAWLWLQGMNRKGLAKLTLKLTFTGENLPDEDDYFQADPYTGLENYLGALRKEEVRFEVGVSDEKGKVEILNPWGFNQPLPYSPGSPLAELVMKVKAIARASEWWNEAETLYCLLCGKEPIGGIVANVQNNFSEKNGRVIGSLKEPTSVTLQIRSPTTPKDLQKEYGNVLKSYGLNPKPLKKQSIEVLRIVYDTPSATWPERLKEWNKRCNKDQGLKPYKESNGLIQAYQRALKATSWLG
jgi:hypothetical protein